MKSVRFEAILTYDDAIMHGGNAEDEAWFWRQVKKDAHLLVGAELGDTGGEFSGIRISALSDAEGE